MSHVVKIEMQKDIAVICFNRPYALTAELAAAISESLIEFDARESVKGIVLTGAGERAFCAGVDFMEARTVNLGDIEQWFGTVCNIYKRILLTNKPVIAALNGVAAGGGFQMALVSDQRVAHADASMGQSEINAAFRALWAPTGCSLHLGWSKNQELSMTGRLLGAEEAHALGLINYLVSQEELIPMACRIARDFASKPSVAWARTKLRFREIALSGFDEAFRAGVLGQQEAYAKGEPQAVIDAFMRARA
tara:strand:- start:52778 stop:53527 length:750 start_codon:yes stop_codon:yes gene_type:complete